MGISLSPLAAYRQTPAGQIREALKGSWIIEGDPDRMTGAMIRMADQEGPLPKRACAYVKIRTALSGRLDERDRQKEISVAADFTDEELARL